MKIFGPLFDFIVSELYRFYDQLSLILLCAREPLAGPP